MHNPGRQWVRSAADQPRFPTLGIITERVLGQLPPGDPAAPIQLRSAKLVMLAVLGRSLAHTSFRSATPWVEEVPLDTSQVVRDTGIGADSVEAAVRLLARSRLWDTIDRGSERAVRLTEASCVPSVLPEAIAWEAVFERIAGSSAPLIVFWALSELLPYPWDGWSEVTRSALEHATHYAPKSVANGIEILERADIIQRDFRPGQPDRIRFSSWVRGVAPAPTALDEGGIANTAVGAPKAGGEFVAGESSGEKLHVPVSQSNPYREVAASSMVGSGLQLQVGGVRLFIEPGVDVHIRRMPDGRHLYRIGSIEFGD